MKDQMSMFKSNSGKAPITSWRLQELVRTVSWIVANSWRWQVLSDEIAAVEASEMEQVSIISMTSSPGQNPPGQKA
ncbi:MAG: hypothetical protein E5X74_17480 [Mesorhizobium sp.]|uniref:hypothetical protein n=1 Tax=Mesorhizobium sp. TaxID=1871066 RepID=UPI001206F93C|nr:hypothetical protein [Mesorhizobium sp.]TIO84061.1 MAG: hypothetical protein E5X74_17480 [Mesorhizobium sp.]